MQYRPYLLPDVHTPYKTSYYYILYSTVVLLVLNLVLAFRRFDRFELFKKFESRTFFTGSICLCKIRKFAQKEAKFANLTCLLENKLQMRFASVLVHTVLEYSRLNSLTIKIFNSKLSWEPLPLLYYGSIFHVYFRVCFNNIFWVNLHWFFSHIYFHNFCQQNGHCAVIQG